MFKKLLFFVVLLFPISVCAIIRPDSNLFVVDNSKTLSVSTIQYMNEQSTYLHDNELIDYYVVVTTDLEDMNMEEYADTLFQEYPISNNGILILVSRGDGLLRVQVGSELTSMITEATVNDYLDHYFTPYIQYGDWDKGLLNGYNSFYKLICDKNKIDSSHIVVKEKVDFMTKYLNYIVVIITIISALIVWLLYKMYQKIFVKRKSKNVTLDCFLFALVMALNLALFIVSYFLKPSAILAILLIEGVCLYSFYNADHPSPSEELPVPPEHIKIIPHKKKHRNKKDNK